MKKTKDGIEDMEQAMGDAIVEAPFFTSVEDMESGPDRRAESVVQNAQEVGKVTLADMPNRVRKANIEIDPDRNPDGTFKKGTSIRKPYAITPDTAREMQKKSVASRLANQKRENERQLQAAIQAIATEDIADPEQAVGYIVAQQAVLAASPDLSPHSSTRAAAFVLKETGRGQEDKRLTVKVGDDAISGGEDTVLSLLYAARANKQESEKE